MKRTMLLGLALILTSCNGKAPELPKLDSIIHRSPSPAVPRDTLTPEARAVKVAIRLSPRSDTSAMGSDNVKIFAPRDTVHGIIRTENASDGQILTGRWYFSNGFKMAENRAELKAGINNSYFDLIHNKPWPKGEYKLVVLIDNAPKDSAVFTVAPK